MEPTLATAPELQEVLAELSAQEPIFHRPEFGTSRADFERMTVEDYWETGASGRATQGTLFWMGWRNGFPCRMTTCGRREISIAAGLGPETYLLTYTLLQDKQRLTRRATIWQRTADGWKIVYHQGTIVEDA
jgi:hypothetical protein